MKNENRGRFRIRRRMRVALRVITRRRSERLRKLC